MIKTQCRKKYYLPLITLKISVADLIFMMSTKAGSRSTGIFFKLVVAVGPKVVDKAVRNFCLLLSKVMSHPHKTKFFSIICIILS